MINTLVVFREVLANDGISNVPVPNPRSEEKLMTRGQACDCAILERAIQPEVPFC